MAPSPDAGDSRATGEDRLAEQREAEEPTRPQSELRWVQIREPRRAVEIGRNGRIVDSYFHEGYDAWEVLLETYEGELSE